MKKKNMNIESLKETLLLTITVGGLLAFAHFLLTVFA